MLSQFVKRKPLRSAGTIAGREAKEQRLASFRAGTASLRRQLPNGCAAYQHRTGSSAASTLAFVALLKRFRFIQLL